jgi:hypothetical protein
MNRRHLLARRAGRSDTGRHDRWHHGFTLTRAPDVWIKRLSTDVLDTIKADKSLQSGNLAKSHSAWSTARSCPTWTSCA